MNDIDIIRKALARKHPTDPAHAALSRIEALYGAANTWWKGKRPLSQTEADHVANPAINTTGNAEGALARAVADIIRLSAIPSP